MVWYGRHTQIKTIDIEEVVFLLWPELAEKLFKTGQYLSISHWVPVLKDW